MSGYVMPEDEFPGPSDMVSSDEDEVVEEQDEVEEDSSEDLPLARSYQSLLPPVFSVNC